MFSFRMKHIFGVVRREGAAHSVGTEHEQTPLLQAVARLFKALRASWNSSWIIYTKQLEMLNLVRMTCIETVCYITYRKGILLAS